MGADNEVINRIFETVVGVISSIMQGIISVIFINNYIAIIVYLVLVNLLAVFLMKKDKELAKTPNARRIRESTLLIVAFSGGGLGEYYAMYKYKHKTLHQKFLVGVPLAILLHFLILSYSVFVGIAA